VFVPLTHWDAVANKPEDIAKEGTLSQGINEVKNAVANIDLSTVAKESTLLETRSLTNGKFGDVFVKFGELTTFIAQKFDWISNFIVTKKDELQQFISDRKLELHNLIAIDILGAINRNHGELLGKTNDVLGRQQAYENNAAARTQDTINVVNSQGSQLGKHLDDNKWALMGKVDEGVNTLSAKIDNIKLPEIDTTELAKQGDNQEATNSRILEELNEIRGKKVDGEYTTLEHLRKMLNTMDIDKLLTEKSDIASAITLMGGNSSFKDPSNPTLQELLQCLQTIPQELLKITSSGGQLETNEVLLSWDESLRYAYLMAQAFQNKIDEEGGIKSVMYEGKIYKGFYMMEFPLSVLTKDTSSGEFYLSLSKVHADAFYVGFESGAVRLIEWGSTDSTLKQIRVSMSSLPEGGKLFVFALYEDDAYDGNVMYTNKGSVLIIGGHPASIFVYTSNGRVNSGTGARYTNGIIQLNETNNTDYYLHKVITNNIYLKQHFGILKLNNADTHSKVSLPFFERTGLNINGLYDSGYTISSCSLMNELELGNLKNTYAPIVNGCLTLQSVRIDSLEEIVTSLDVAKQFNISLISSCSNLHSVYLPNLRYIKAESGDNGNISITLISYCEKLAKLDLSSLEEFENACLINGNTQLEELKLDNLHTIKKTSAINTISILNGDSKIKVLRLPKLKTANQKGHNGNNMGIITGNNPTIEEIYCDELEEAYFITGSSHAMVVYMCNNLLKIDMPKARNIYCGNTAHGAFSELPKLRYLRLGVLERIYLAAGTGALIGDNLVSLIHLEIGYGTDASMYLENWNPTNALDSSKYDLVEDSEYSNNLQQFRANFVEYIARRLYNHKPNGVHDGVVRVMKLNKNVYNALTQNELDEVMNRGWDIATA
jgi:hypothetical protein